MVALIFHSSALDDSLACCLLTRLERPPRHRKTPDECHFAFGLSSQHYVTSFLRVIFASSAVAFETPQGYDVFFVSFLRHLRSAAGVSTAMAKTRALAAACVIGIFTQVLLT